MLKLLHPAPMEHGINSTGASWSVKVTWCVCTNSTWYGSCYLKRLSVPQSAKAGVGSRRHRPGSGCSQLCHPPLGCRTAPTILWQPSPAGDTSDSVGSARSCRAGGEYERKTAWIHHVWRLISLERLKNSVILIHHLTTYLCTSDRSCVRRAEWGRPFRPCRCSTPPHPSAASLCTDTQTVGAI